MSSETTIRLRRRRRGLRRDRRAGATRACVRYMTAGDEGDFVMRPHLRRRPRSESPGGDFGPRSYDWLVALRRSIIRTQPLLIKHQGRRTSLRTPTVRLRAECLDSWCRSWLKSRYRKTTISTPPPTSQPRATARATCSWR